MTELIKPHLCLAPISSIYLVNYHATNITIDRSVPDATKRILAILISHAAELWSCDAATF